jgi:hypothetical protein
MTSISPYKIVESDLLAYFRLQEQGAPALRLSPLAWAEAYRRIDDQPFSLDYDPELRKGYEPLRQIYDDDHPFIVVMKPAQVGVSEMAITRALHSLDVGAHYWNTSNDGLNVGYLFPTQDALYDFSKERISGLKDESDHLSNFFSDFDDVGFKKAGHSYFYIRGAWSTKALKSFKADDLIFDEYDEMLPKAAALAEKRLRHSQVKRQLRLSTPTNPNYGIHALYLISDKMEWEVLCSQCGEWNTLDFFRDVKVDDADYDDWQSWESERVYTSEVHVECPSCREPLTDADRFGPGRWVARAPEVTRIRGYHVPALSFPSVSLLNLCLAAISTDPEQVIEFYRSDLGLPYEPQGSRITQDMLKKLSSDLEGGKLPVATWTGTTMGVDVGARYHFRISSTGPDRKRYVRAMGSVKTWEELDQLMDEYKVRHVVVDAMPELHGAEAWSDKHKGKVTRAFYKELKGELFRLPASEEKAMHGLKVTTPRELRKDTVLIDRTMAMDTIYNIVATGKEAWPALIHNESEVVTHMTAPVRVITTDKNGQPQASWVHTKPDHLFHACVYDLIAQRVLPKPLPGIFAHGTVNVRLANES